MLHTAIDAYAKAVQPTYAQAPQDMQHALCLTLQFVPQHRYLNKQRASKFGYEHLQSIRYNAQLALVTAIDKKKKRQEMSMPLGIITGASVYWGSPGGLLFLSGKQNSTC